MNGNSNVTANGHQEYNKPSINSDINLNGKFPFGSSYNTEASNSTFPAKNVSNLSNMATNGNGTSSDEHPELNFVDITRRYCVML